MKNIKKIFQNSTVLLSIISTLMFFTGVPQAFAATVGFDTGGASGTSPIALTVSATAGVAVAYVTNGTAPCTATFGGVSMKKELETTVGASATPFASFYLANPLTGSQNFAWSCSGGTGAGKVMTYLGTGWAATADNVAIAAKANGSGSALTMSIVTASTGNIIGTSAVVNGGVAIVAGSGMTIRVTQNVANIAGDITNFATGPTTVSMPWQNTGGNTTDIEMMGMTIAQATSSVVTPKFNFSQFFDF